MALPTALVAAGLAAASPQPATIPGPAQVLQAAPALPAASDKPPPRVVLPAPVAVQALPPPDDFAALTDPAAETPALVADPADPATAALDAAATAPDPFEDELAREIKPADDPLEGFNRISFAVSMAIDKVLLRPLALGFQAVAPRPLRDGMRNLLSNWGEPIVFLNDILQFRPQRAIRTLGRFLLNTVLGLGGLFDIAREKKFNLPYHSNRFADTLGFYGVKPGPYIYLPLLGPTSLRDEADRFQTFVGFFDNPLFRGNRGTAFTVASGLDQRAENDTALKALLEDAIDPYATFRETWLQQRKGQIDQLKAPDGQEPGSATTGALDGPLADPLVDPAGAPAPAATTPAP
ncbi:MAG: VacJ family lipoprotein [Novosphingobium sp.]